MQALKQSTTVTIKLGPFLDKTDGVTEEIALTPVVEVSKNGAAFAARNSATVISHDAEGYYAVELNATDTGALGRLRVKAHDPTLHLPVWQDYMIMPANVWDSLFGADVLQVDLTQMGGVAQSATDLKDFADAGYDPATNKVQGVVLVDTVTALTGHTAQTGDSYARIGTAGAGLTNINLPNQTMDITGSLSGSVGSVTGSVGSIANAPANWSSLIITASGAVDSLVQGYLNTLIAETTAGRIAANFDNFYDNANALTTKVVDDVGTATAATDWTATEKENIRYRLGVNGTQTAPTSNVPILPIRLDAQGKLDVNAECDTAIVDGALATAASQTTTNNHLTDIKGATWSALTDSLEKIRDRGDSAWATAVGFSTHTAASVWAVATRLLTAGTNIALAKGTGLTGLNDLSAAQVNAEVDTALDTAIPASPTAGSANEVLQSQARSAGTIQDGAAVAGTLSTTFMTTDLTVTVADQYNGRIIIFANDTTTAALRGQATDVLTTTVSGSKLGFTALTTAPVATDTFSIV